MKDTLGVSVGWKERACEHPICTVWVGRFGESGVH